MLSGKCDQKQQGLPQRGSNHDRHAATDRASCGRSDDQFKALGAPWRLDDLEHFTGTGISYWIIDRIGCVVGVFLDKEIALAIVQLVNHG